MPSSSKKSSEASRRREQERFRDRVIAAIGMKPEEKTREGRYVITTGELIRSIREESRSNKGVSYFPSLEQARIVAETFDLGIDRVIRYELGWAIQREKSGPYLGPKGWT